MIRVVIRPVTRIWARRQQWAFQILGANGEPIDPVDTYNNRGDLVRIIEKAFSFSEPVELVVMDRFGNVEERRRLR